MSEKAPKVTIDTLTADNLSHFTPQSHEEEAIAEKIQNGYSFNVVDKRASSTIKPDVINDTPDTAPADKPADASDTVAAPLDQPDIDRPLTSPLATALDRFAHKAQMAADVREAYKINNEIEKSKNKVIKDKQDAIKKRALHVKQLEFKDDFDEKVESAKKKVEKTTRAVGSAGLMLAFSGLLMLGEAQQKAKKAAEKARNAEVAKKAVERTRKFGGNAVVLYHRGRAAADAASESWRESKAA